MLAHLLPILLGVSTAVGQGFDHSAYSALLGEVAGPQGVDYGALSEKGEVLSAYLQGVAAANPAEMATAERTAFWINAYNATTLKLVIDNLPLASIRDLDEGRVWDARTFVIGGERLTLNQLENDRLRPLGDPRIHAALNCAARGCPALRSSAYDAVGLDGALDEAARAWVRGGGVEIDRDRRLVSLSQIFEWYREDFDAPASTPEIPGVDSPFHGSLHFVARFLDPADAAWIRQGQYQLASITYDWSLNDR